MSLLRFSELGALHVCYLRRTRKTEQQLGQAWRGSLAGDDLATCSTN